jgi:diguanylate cyclase (GGDEF)-like protein
MSTILVVDDRPVNREFLLTLLGYAGHRLFEAADGEAALELVRAERPDLVLTDIMMPGLDGYRFVLQLRSEPGIPPTRVVFLTAVYVEPEARALAHELGVSRFITKPVEPDVLTKIVDAVLAEPVPNGGAAGAGRTDLIDKYLRLTANKLHRHTLELEQLSEQVVRDPLTGLFNRRYLEESFEREMSRAKRSGVSIGIMMIDIDHFKRINDSLGHAAGDTVLAEIARRMRSLTRSEDILCRYGGEEFTLVMTGGTRKVAFERAEVIRQGVRQLRIESAGRPVGQVTVSIGIAVHPEDGASMAEALRAADAALYLAKQTGRDRTVASAIERA